MFRRCSIVFKWLCGYGLDGGIDTVALDNFHFCFQVCMFYGNICGKKDLVNSQNPPFKSENATVVNMK